VSPHHSTPALSFAEASFDHGDLILAAVAWGEWQALELSLAADLARVAGAERRGERPDLDDAVVAFRRARRLSSGEDYRRWLKERSLTTADVDAHLLRVALRESGEASVAPALSGDVIAAEAILSGALRAWAERLAACAAAARALAADGTAGSAALPAPQPDDRAIADLIRAAAGCRASGLSEEDVRVRAPRIAALHAAEPAFRDRVLTRERIERCLAEHRLDWQRVSWLEVAVASEGAAREAALLVREQGLGLDEVARLAHATVQAREAYCAEVPGLAAALVAAVPGELVGPLRTDDHWRLLSLRARAAPGIDDDALRARASQELITDALQRHLAGQVKWHAEL